MAFALALGLGTVAAGAATPAPRKTAAPHRMPERVDVSKLQPKALLPKKKLHSEFVVEVNKLGQVARVRSTKPSGSPTFDAQTYGNSLQAFIRLPDGEVVLGTYRLTYDYDPKTARVRRSVTLVSRGGVDPNARGAALDMIGKAHVHTPPPKAPTLGVTPAPHPAPSVNIQRLPDLNNVIHPSPTPH